MQKPTKPEVKRVTVSVPIQGPAKPPRLKAAKKHLQFESPLPRRTRTRQQQRQQGQLGQPDKVIAMPSNSQDADTDAAAEAGVDVPETEPLAGPVPVVELAASQDSVSQSAAIKRRLAEGCSRLMYACQRGDIVQVLAQMRAKPQLLRQRDRSNRNALHYCAAQDLEQTRDLVAAASIAIAAPELLESADEDGFTPLHLAVIQGNLAMVNLLLANKADVNAVDNEGHSVVHWATVCGEVESLRAVLSAGANVAQPDVNGGTPLHYAAQMCGASYDSKQQSSSSSSSSSSSKLALEILGILLSHPQSSVDVQDKDGRQPLLWAASAGSAKAVIALVKAGARVESADKDGLTALHCAGSRGHTECIDTLISLCGAPTDLIDSNGCTALHYAVTLGHADSTARLLDLEADPNRQDRKGRTPAHCGCAKGQFETLKLLKERGANLWLRNAKGDLPLHEAAASGRRELVEWLLAQRSKQVNTTSNDGRSLLHIAAANDYTDMCKLLLDYGADVNAVYRNSRGLVLTPLDGALQRGHRSTAKFLQANGGQPSNKVKLTTRRGNPFHEANAADLVRPLKYVEKEELQDLRSSKKYVVYLKQTDAGREDADADAVCSCAEETYRKEQRLRHVCRRHKRRQLRRRTSSCGESKHEKCSDLCRSKSNIEIRRRQSRERCASSSEWEGEEYDEDSCENCCYHKRRKERVVSRKRSTSSRRSKEQPDSDGDEGSEDNKGSRKQIEVHGDPPASSVGREQPGSAQQTPPNTASKERTFIKSPSQSAKSEKSLQAEPLQAGETHAVELTDEEQETAKSVVTQVDVHHDAEQLPAKSSEELALEQPAAEEVKQEQQEEQQEHQPEAKLQLSEEETQLVSKEVEQVIKIAATALSSESKSSSEEPPPEVAQNEAEKVAKDSPPTPEPVAPAPATPTAPAPASGGGGGETAEPEPPKAGEQPSEAAATQEELEPPSEPAKRQVEPKKPPTAQQPRPATQTPASASASAPVPVPSQSPAASQSQSQEQQQPQREQESRRSFTLLPSDSADDDPVAAPGGKANASDEPLATERKSSFHVLQSDESVGELERAARPGRSVDYSNSNSNKNNQVFQVVGDGSAAGKLPSAAELEQMDYDYEEYDEEEYDDDIDGIDPEHDSALRRFLSTGHRHGVAGAAAAVDGATATATSDATGAADALASGRKRRLKKRVRSGAKTRSNWKNAQETRDGGTGALTSKDQDSGFEPSPRAERSKIPTLRSAHTAMPRRPIYATLDGRSCSSRLENRKPGDKGACDMAAVTRSIQRNIRRYYMERKIFQHLLELKSLQIRSSKLNEAVLVKRAVDDYHKSCVLLNGETGTRLRRYNFSEYTFKNFELFLYETLKGLQKPGTNNFQNINDVYEEAERRLSPDYNAYEKALQCTTKTHRCLHAAHAYTGIPCAAYIPMMNHHTMPKFGFGPYKKTGSVSSFFLPKILTSGRASSGRAGGLGGSGDGVGAGSRCNHKVALELSHGKNKQLISLPAEKLDSNKRYYVTFTVKDSSGHGSAIESHKQYQKQQHHHQQKQQQCGNTAGEPGGGGGK
ncbi:protein phosphatase 1 regulatory subunit 12A [Drosophila obscura]|uniref:protein phosphatase 1 regulatory subunit 12A n=1 Tax=Drosophila obscura TaxID=7282 RepID=UPI001BB27EDA|nr:protein phosphatase 1 regulatory subunit 12A [Drosophila obscura]